MIPGGGTIEQSDATSWMGMYCLNMMVIALELARENRAYEDVASKFLEHFVYIARAMNNIAGQGIELWDRADGFYYDVLRMRDGRTVPLRVRSMVGLIPLFAVETLESELVDTLPGFKRRMQWFIDNLPELADSIETCSTPDSIRRFLSLVGRDRLRRVLKVMLDEDGVPVAVRHPVAVARAPEPSVSFSGRAASSSALTTSPASRGRVSSAATRTGAVRSGFRSTFSSSSRSRSSTTSSAATSWSSARPARGSGSISATSASRSSGA